MQIAAQMAGFTLGQADLLRRAVSKKEHQQLRDQRTAFVSGCLKNGYEEQVGHQVYDLIVRFADYGFNRSHSAAYAVLAYQTAYLKANHPLAYMAALLTTVMGSQGKLAEYIDVCRRMGIQVMPPDINRSDSHFTVEEDAIRFGLAGIKNVGTHAIEEIQAQRKAYPFRDLFDFCSRVDARLCNRRVLESLIQAGAMDSLGDHRALLLAMLDEALEKGAAEQRRRFDSQLSLFNEKETLRTIIFLPGGNTLFYEGTAGDGTGAAWFVSIGSSTSSLCSVIQAKATHSLDNLAGCRHGERVTVAGLITEIKPITTKKGDSMAFVTLEDLTHRIEVVVFPRILQAYRDQLRVEPAVLLTGRISQDEKGTKLLVDRVEDLTLFLNKGIENEGNKEKGNEKKAQPDLPAVYIRISKRHEEKAVLQALKRVLLDHPGKAPVRLDHEGSQQVLALPVDKYGIEPSRGLSDGDRSSGR